MSATPESVSVMIQTAGGLALITSTVEPPTFTRDLNIAIAVVALFLAGICICRMNALSPRKHKLRVRLHYLFVFIGAICIAGGPWLWPLYPRAGSFIFVCTVVVSLLLSTTEWHYGAPPSANLSYDPDPKEVLHDRRIRPVANYFSHLWRSFKYYAAMVNDLFRGNHR